MSSDREPLLGCISLVILIGEILSMSCHKYLWYLGAFSAALCVKLVIVSLTALPLKAQSIQVSLTFPPAAERGAPARTAGGGQRGKCTDINSSLTALTPINNVVTTISANPTLFWYVPQTEAKSAEFVVLDDQGNKVYLATLALNDTPGVVKLTLPKAVSLKTGKEYIWEFALVCDKYDRGSDELVRGRIERTELSSEQKTKLAATTEPLKQAEVYARAQVWQETVNLLAQLRHDRPYDSKVSDAWKELLRSVQLDAIATEPLVECCTADSGVNGQ